MRRAARSASIDTSGSVAPRLNQANSSRFRPLNMASRCDPVRIRPGTTVVTEIPCLATSEDRPSLNPTAANFAEQ